MTDPDLKNEIRQYRDRELGKALEEALALAKTEDEPFLHYLLEMAVDAQREIVASNSTPMRDTGKHPNRERKCER